MKYTELAHFPEKINVILLVDKCYFNKEAVIIFNKGHK